MSGITYMPSSEILGATRRNIPCLLTNIASEFLPRERVPTAEFAEEALVLPQEVAEQHGRFQLYYVPHVYGIFAALDDPSVHEVDCMKAAQVAWTTTLIAYLANRIVNEPCAMIGLFDSDGAARDFHDEKFVPIIESTSALSNIIDVRKTRSAGNRADFKRFPGGFLKLGGSGQVRKVKSTSAGVLFVEEPDDAKDNVRDQGDAIQLLWERAKRRRKVKRILGGTPSLKGFSQVAFRIELSDKRVLPVSCHECGDKHVLDLDHVVWQDHDGESHPVYGQAMPETAVYVCPLCGAPWDDNQRKANIRTTVQRSILECDPHYGWTPTKPFNGIAGFHELNEAYSCLPGVGMAEYVKDKLEADHAATQGDLNKLIVHINSKHGRPYEFRGEHAQKEEIEAAALDYPEGSVPSGGLLLTAGVDVQHDRLSILVRAYGRDQESWLVLWYEPAAKLACSDQNDPIWDEMEERLYRRTYPSEDGFAVRVSAVSIDSGDGQTNDAVYAFVTRMRKRYPRVQSMAIKGASAGDPEIFSTPKIKTVDPRNPNRTTKADRWGLRVFIVGTDRAKDYLDQRWRLEASGHGKHHAYAGVRADYWDQITAEVKVPNPRLRGKKTWKAKIGIRNEALDCEVYAEHAARSQKAHAKTIEVWAALENGLRQTSLFDEPDQPAVQSGETSSAPQGSEAAAKQPTKRPPARRSNFVTGWRD